MNSPSYDGLFGVLSAIILQCDIGACFKFAHDEDGSDEIYGIILPREECVLLFADYPASCGLVSRFLNDDLDRKMIYKVVCHMCIDCFEYSECVINYLVCS
jgi:hypothetical protein